LSAEQVAHLQDLEAKRRAMAAIRRGQPPAPSPFDGDRERKLAELRAAGHLSADQELFLRLCGPDEVDRQHVLYRTLGPMYGGVIVPSLSNLKTERRLQKEIRRVSLRGHEHGVAPGATPPLRLRRLRFVRRSLVFRRRRELPRRVRSKAATSGDDSSEPPPSGVRRRSPHRGAS
jgi:hypothetical protein